MFPVIVAMVIYLVVAKISMRIDGEVGIKPLDDLKTMMVKIKEHHMTGVVFTGLVIMTANKIV